LRGPGTERTGSSGGDLEIWASTASWAGAALVARWGRRDKGGARRRRLWLGPSLFHLPRSVVGMASRVHGGCSLQVW
jgi:hypothetical protein